MPADFSGGGAECNQVSRKTPESFCDSQNALGRYAGFLPATEEKSDAGRAVKSVRLAVELRR
jgi:hypothetical protein